MSNNEAKDLVSSSMAGQYRSFTLAQLQTKIAKDRTFSKDFRHVPEHTQLNFEKLGEKTITSPGQKLLVGTYRKLEKEATHDVWAHAHCLVNADSVNQISYFLGDNTKLNLNEIAKVEFVQPFQQLGSIDTARTRDKVRFLILFYFLEKGCLEKIEFKQDGFDLLRLACATVAKAQRDTDKGPARRNTHKGPVQRRMAVVKVRPGRKAHGSKPDDPSETSLPSSLTTAFEVGTSTDTSIAAKTHLDTQHLNRPDVFAPMTGRLGLEELRVLSTDANTAHQDGEHTKRASEVIAEADDEERYSKRQNTNDGLYHFQKFVEQIRRHTDDEYEALKIEATSLRSQNSVMERKLSLCESSVLQLQKESGILESRRHQLEDKLNKANKLSELSALSATKLTKERDAKHMLLVQEIKVRREGEQEKIEILKELGELKPFKTHFLKMMSDLQESGSLIKASLD
ncbi:hypothetical protein P153DRAFT_357119 [Dothidotthia symphoricarpi CBS 119687]|uniref:Uncharacterized protein n=1 Tax=Dothidotthia symphoricarpi CBS 119687 TaxID=1392245 RepID=A0A6A6AE45_9PLEO|nr:uncharacterized protein P153DRAFT_357119 [Dothidotthia symphoricarpi CBS 119687]KAF2129563.1 hypothetical protein P153DRAFT_357119 [Dothidotthia symphoricarpi CBS 119687]